MMIRVLDPLTADKIAAGEVIDRPLAIVKELVENAIDAESTSIIIEIRNGGKSYIRITDNGIGIAADEVETAFLRHATGKLREIRDLDSLVTLGFRGEALASIAAVSRLTIFTRPKAQERGVRLELHGGRKAAREETGSNAGTTIVVEDVFYNIPARRKFMRSDAAEASAIIDLIQRMALYYSSIAFKLINNGKTILTTFGDGDVRTTIQSVYPEKAFRNLIEIKGTLVHGFISDPGTVKSNRSGQVFFVNGRIIRSDVIEKGIEKGYGDRIFEGFPIAILFLTVPPDQIDVNIHPTKKEIRFLDAASVVQDIESAIRKVLYTKESIPESTAKPLPERSKEEVETTQLGIRDFLNRKLEAEMRTETSSLPSVTEKDGADGGFRNRKIEAEMKTEASGPSFVDMDGADGLCIRETEAVPGAPAPSPAPKEAAELPSIHLEPPGTRLFDFGDLVVSGYVFNTYIITQTKDALYVLDQHAAHERILYEKLVTEYERGRALSQPMLVPIMIEVPMHVYDGERRFLPVLERLGYLVEDFGGGTFLLREIPAYMGAEEAERFAREVMEAEEGGSGRNRIAVDKLIMRSCKAAVKANDVLSDREIEDLLASLSRCVNPFSCPHGRPTFIRVTRYEVERAFKRK